MKILFVHDHKFKFKENKFYSNGSFPSSIWPRYTIIFNELTVVGRNGGELTAEDKGFTLSNAEGVSFKLLPNLANLKSLIFGNKEAEQAAKKMVAKHDALIARLPSRMGMLFVKEAIKQNKPYAIEVVGCPWDGLWNYGNLKGKLLAPYSWFELKQIAKKTKFAIYVTEFFLQRRYPTSANAVTTFCSNVEIPAVAPEVLTARLEKISNKPANEPLVFGLIANYSSKYKGIDVAIKALKEANLPNWQFKVLGNGDPAYYQQLAKELQVEGKVHFVGSLPAGEAVFEWIDSLDIYLQPSFTEGLPRALAEAMSHGLPAFATAVGGIPELLPSTELIKAGDYQDLAKKITALAVNKEQQLKLAEQNFNKAKNYYKETLDERRNEFWVGFREQVKKQII